MRGEKSADRRTDRQTAFRLYIVDGTAQFKLEEKLRVVILTLAMHIISLVFSPACTCKTTCSKNTYGYAFHVSMRVPIEAPHECISEYSKRVQDKLTCTHDFFSLWTA